MHHNRKSIAHIFVATPRPAVKKDDSEDDDDVGAGEVLAGAAVLVPVIRLVWTDKIRNVGKCVFGFLIEMKLVQAY